MRCFHEIVRPTPLRPPLLRPRGKPLPPAPGAWALARIAGRGRRTWLSRTRAFGVPGMIGLWIKADSVTAFDAFICEERT